MKPIDIKNVVLSFVLVILSALTTNAQQTLWVGESYTFDVSSSVMGLTANMSWSTNGGYLSLSGSGFYRTITVTQYFSGTATVTCEWDYKLTGNGSYTHTKRQVTISCRDNQVSISPTSLTMSPGETRYVSYRHQYDNQYTFSANAYFQSSNPSVCTVSSSGEVIAINPGTADINVYSKISSVSPYCKVTVNSSSPDPNPGNNDPISYSGTWLSPENYDISWYDYDKDYFEITSGRQLAGVAFLVNNNYADFKGKVIALISDIDLSDNKWIPIGGENTAFKGKIKGNSYNIFGIQMESSSSGYIGFCGNVEDAEISKINLNGNIDITDDSSMQRIYIGGLSAYVKNSQIDNCNINLDINYTKNVPYKGFEVTINIGGLLGIAYNSTITYCTVKTSNIIGKIKNNQSYYKASKIIMGGLVGSLTSSDLKYSGAIINSLIGNADKWSDLYSHYGFDVGGLVGTARQYSMQSCYSNVDRISVIYNTKNEYDVNGFRFGGLVGVSGTLKNIQNSYSSTNRFCLSASKNRSEIHWGGIIGAGADSKKIENTFSPSDCFLDTNCSSDYVINEDYFGLRDYTQQLMKSDSFLKDLNLYSKLKYGKELWQRTSEYPEIVNWESSGIEAINNSELLWKINGYSIIFNDNYFIVAYDINGNLVYCGTTNIVHLPFKGLYILNVKHKNIKVLI